MLCCTVLYCAVLFGQCLPHPALVLCCLPPTLSQALPLYSASAESNSSKDVSMPCFHHSITHALYISPFYPPSISHPLAILPPLLYLAHLITSLLPQNSSSLPSLSDSSLSYPTPPACPSLPFPVPVLPLSHSLPCPSPSLLRTASQLNPLLYSTSGGYCTSSTKRRRSSSSNSSLEGAFVVSYPALYFTVLLFWSLLLCLLFFFSLSLSPSIYLSIYLIHSVYPLLQWPLSYWWPVQTRLRCQPQRHWRRPPALCTHMLQPSPPACILLHRCYACEAAVCYYSKRRIWLAVIYCAVRTVWVTYRTSTCNKDKYVQSAQTSTYNPYR